jgi:hypothetical protein
MNGTRVLLAETTSSAYACIADAAGTDADADAEADAEADADGCFD